MILVALIASVLLNLFCIAYKLYKIGFFNNGTRKDPLRERRMQYFDIFPLHHEEVVFVGDSHVEMFPLGDAFPGQVIRNRGVGGDKTADLLARIDEVVAARPRLILIQIGANDFRGQNRVTVGDAAKNAEAIILKLAVLNSATIIWQSVLPSNKGVAPAEIAQLNLDIEYLANVHQIAFYNLNVHFKNEYGGLSKLYDCGDGLHLNAAGYKHWAALIPEILNTKP